MTEISLINGPHGQLACHFDERSSDRPPIIFLCGFKSDMNGSKAQWLSNYCARHNRSYLRFDYFAHGQSDGDFHDYTIGKGLGDSLFMIEKFITHPAIIIGSSMGGWIALRLLQYVPHLVHGFIGIAAAPDFTRKIYQSFDDGHLAQLDDKGYVEEESDYDEPYIFTKALLDDGEYHCVLDSKILFDGFVHLLQGKQDSSVDWQMPEAIQTIFDREIDITLIDDGDHSLSRAQDLDLLQQVIEKMSA